MIVRLDHVKMRAAEAAKQAGKSDQSVTTATAEAKAKSEAEKKAGGPAEK